ncbi:hypothetical protein AQ938_06995 [Burkholderia pseudomallei]|uniref:hypothetical protein n=1 Tax=Burkholderia pseudomallei TaxID=28450 RepID=UPI000055B589|nr:hypothetical protein [Burkholderia pseudomallei]AJX62514.1 hypothetical protein DP47_3367 [Burkholderia pseudomallei Pasteur 52237]EDO95622.1 conserved hypothetical protein [Burkholderia pseudomallei Pasteur 52237]OND79019.1 hypothetical protein AQ938_06995 [Burkholderia pseudomallei]VBQ80863.1 Uncharacterised protein [Burkholderia pseudomallei]
MTTTTIKDTTISPGAAQSNVETPTQAVMRQTGQEVTIEDSRGRKIALRKPGVLAQYAIIDAVGGESAKNPVYMSMVLPLIYVASIDGEAVSTPNTKLEVKALIKRLDEDGIEAVISAVSEKFAAPDPDADRETLKKS